GTRVRRAGRVAVLAERLDGRTAHAAGRHRPGRPRRRLLRAGWPGRAQGLPAPRRIERALPRRGRPAPAVAGVRAADRCPLPDLSERMSGGRARAADIITGISVPLWSTPRSS